MDHLPKLGRRQRWLRAGRKHAVMSMWRALVALGLCAFIFGLTAGIAFAQTCTYWKVDNPGTPTFASSQLACQAAAETSLAGSAYSNLVVTVTPANSTQHWCSMTYTLSSNNYTSNDFTLARSSAGSGSQCPVVCTEGASLGPAGDSVYEVPSLGTAVCFGGCTARGTMAGGSGSKFYVWGPFKADGTTCTGSGAGAGSTPTEPAPSPQQPGFCPGTVNGVTVSVPCGQSAVPSASAASAVSTSASGVATPGPTTKTSSETICNGNACQTITTTTTTNVDGSKNTTTTIATEPTQKDSFCKENPGSTICKSSSFGGSCAGGFTCDGDAVQCAIAREQRARNCALYETVTPQSTAGNAALTAGDRPGDHPANSPTAEALDFSSRIDQTDRLGGGSLADLVIPVSALTAVTIPFSQLQTPLAMLGNLLVGVTMLWALFIVFGRAK